MASKSVLFTLPLILKFMCMRIPTSAMKKSGTQSLSPTDYDFLGLGWGCCFYTHFKHTPWAVRWLRNHTLRNTGMWLYLWPCQLLSICSHAGRGNSNTEWDVNSALFPCPRDPEGWLSAAPAAWVLGVGRHKYMYLYQPGPLGPLKKRSKVFSRTSLLPIWSEMLAGSQ